ncbi:hypothetical protein ACIRSU_11595 [Streptomyces sp. NPDC101160]|uniref:hypothetical protein n=1 Tax=Streptomyces sp. NPDC101160 TaxID=3366118 RepID=UPI0038097A3F
MNYADTTAPIYAELIREQGDVPGEVRRTAEEVLRDLSRVIQMPPAGLAPTGAPTGAQMVPAGAQLAPMAPSMQPMQPVQPLAPMQPMHPLQ